MNYKKAGIIIMITVMLVSPSVAGLALGGLDNGENEKISYEKEILLLEKESGAVKKLDVETYIKSVLMSELPLGFEAESAKALAVVLRSSLLYRIESGYGKSGHEYADVCDDYTHCFGYVSGEKAFEIIGEELYNSRMVLIDEAIKETRGMVLLYNGDAVEVGYCFTPVGMSESMECGMNLRECDFYAKRGDKYTDILSRYYPQTEISVW